ncbi:ATP/GTP-binding protein [Streptomyces sioyaensis]|uniref:ATP/GTP-binding protein n=1 Tax=Streptomyces sioyaensis TaxID=67364 RepID=UPI00379F7E36
MHSTGSGVPEAGAAPSGPPQAPARALHRGLLDLRGRTDTPPAPSSPFTLAYPANAVVVVSGLPGSGKSTLLRRAPAQATVIDPRAVHVACEAVMPDWLPYGLYRPWARWKHIRWLHRELRCDGPLLVHDCGSRPWVRRWMARAAGRRSRPLHLVLLDVGRAEALSGQESRGRRAPRRAFARHHRGLDRLLRRLSEAAAAGPPATAVRPAADEASEVPAHRPPLPVPPCVAEAASVVLLGGPTRGLAAWEFARPPRPGRPAGSGTTRLRSGT